MSAYSAFLSCLLCLQIRDRNFCSRGAFAARVVGRTRNRGGVSEFLALRRLEVSAGNIEGGWSGHGHSCTHREHTTIVRTSDRGNGRAAAVTRNGSCGGSRVGCTLDIAGGSPAATESINATG